MIRKAKYTIFSTGAGISTSAGISDYRGPTGVWTLRAKGLKSTAKSTPIGQAHPTLTHMAIATLMRKGLAQYVLTVGDGGDWALIDRGGRKGKGERKRWKRPHLMRV